MLTFLAENCLFSLNLRHFEVFDGQKSVHRAVFQEVAIGFVNKVDSEG